MVIPMWATLRKFSIFLPNKICRKMTGSGWCTPLKRPANFIRPCKTRWYYDELIKRYSIFCLSGELYLGDSTILCHSRSAAQVDETTIATRRRLCVGSVDLLVGE